MRRGLTFVSGLGALAALVVMLVAVIIGPEDGSDAHGVFPDGVLTVGLQDPEMTTVPADETAARLTRFVASGAAVTRVDVRWLEVASTKPADATDPDDPAYTWDRLDAVLKALSARDIEIIIAVSGAPAWSNGGKGPEWAPGVDDYGAFMHALAVRYRSGGGHASVRLYEAWDAPNDPLNLMPQWSVTSGRATPASPAIYAGLLVRASREVKAASPTAQMIGLSAAHIETSAPPSGGVAVGDFAQALVALGPRMDAIAVQITPRVAPDAPSDAVPSLATLPRLVDELDRLAPGAPILVSRFGYATGSGALTEAEQAAYLPAALRRFAATPQIRLVIWHSMRDAGARSDGLLRADGSEKPAWTVFASEPKVRPSRSGP